MIDRPGSRAEWTRIGTLVLLCLAVLFLGLERRALWDIDEGMHAATSREMIETGDWVTPRFNGEPFYDKPPLFNWMVAVSLALLGFTEFAARLPGAALGMAGVLATYGLGRRMVGTGAAFLFLQKDRAVALPLSVPYAIGAALLIAATAPTILLFARRYRAVFALLALEVVALIGFAAIVAVPRIDPYRSSKAAALALDEILPPGERVTFYERILHSALFYTGRRASVAGDPSALASHLRGEDAMLLTDHERLGKVEHEAGVRGSFCVVEQHADKLIIRADSRDQNEERPLCEDARLRSR